MQKALVRLLGFSLVVLMVGVTTGCEWNKTFGGDGADAAQSVQATWDGGFIVAGYTTVSGDTDALLMKVNAFGELTWQKTFGGIGFDCAYAVQQTVDGGYIVAGETAANGGDVWVIKLNGTGETVWEQTFGGALADKAACVATVSDGGYIMGATTTSPENGSKDAWIIKLKSTGELDWDKTVGADKDDIVNALATTSDGGYIAAGCTTSVTGTPDVWIFKLDADGAVVWKKAYDGGGTVESAADIEETSDGGYLAAANREMPSGQDIWLIKLNNDGTWNWGTTIDLSLEDTVAAIERTNDGGYILTGSVSTDGVQTDVFLLKTDATGTYQWDKTFGGTADDAATALCLAVTGGFTVAGSTDSFGAGERDVWLIKTTTTGTAPAIPQ